MSFFEENKKFIIPSIGLILVAVGFAGGYYFYRAGYALEVAPLKIVHQNRENAPKNVNWQILWDAIDMIEKKYVDRGAIDPKQMLYGAVSGVAASLGDPYTVFFSPQKSQEFQQDLKGEFDGIGAEIGLRSNQLVVISPLQDSPAQKAGIKPLDKILKINGEVTDKLTLEEAVGKIRGPKGSQVTLLVMREGFNEPKEFSIISDKIVVKSVTWKTEKTKDGVKVGVIELKRFGEDTNDLLSQAINSLLQQNIRAVILDLRNNPGGYITTAVDVASNWIKDGDVVVSEQYGDGKKDDYKASGVPRLNSLSTVVITNEGSASASEIVAGALHDHGLATLIGKKTFGKGSVQELIDLPEGTNIKITIAKWLTPNGKNINIEGIKPDIEVEIKPADIDAFKDPQMDKALEFLNDKAK